MASIWIIPVVLLLSNFAVQCLHVDDNYKNLISLNGFKETDVLAVILNVYEPKNKSAGIERELIIWSYNFNDARCQPNVLDYNAHDDGNHFHDSDRFIGSGFVKFSKNRPVVMEHEREISTFRFNGWAANRSHIEITEDLTKIPVNDYDDQAVLKPLTDEEMDDLKSGISLMINESPDYAMEFRRSETVELVLSLDELRQSLANPPARSPTEAMLRAGITHNYIL